MSGAGTVRGKEWSAKVEQIGDPGMGGSGTTRAVSPAWKVLVLVMVIRTPEFLNVMLFLEVCCVRRRCQVKEEPNLLCERT